MAHEQAWEDFAFATPARNRYIGSKAHNQTIEYIVAQLNALGDYYTIEKQPFFTDMVINSTGTVTVNGDLKVGNAFDNTKNGSFTGLPLIWINSYGCNSVSLDLQTRGEENTNLGDSLPTGRQR